MNKSDSLVYAGREQTLATNTARTSQLVGKADDDMARTNAIEKISLSDLAKVKQAAETYLEECCRDGFLPTVRGMSARLGLSRNAVYDYQRNHPGSEFSNFLDDFSDLCGELTMQAALEGSVNVVAAIFTAKARAGWRDTYTIENVPPADPEPSLTPEQIAEKYENLMMD